MPDYLKALIELYQQHAHAENALAMEKYMKGLFPFFGIKTPDRRALSKELYSKYGYPGKKEVADIIKICWDLSEREFQYFGMDLAIRFAKKADKSSLALYEFMITEKSWWDTVDMIASKLAGNYFITFPDEKYSVTEKWMRSGNMWLQRTALLFQLSYKENTDLDLLQTYISQLSGSKEFFINKAIGWILRQYSKTNPDWVIDYVNKHSLHPLSHREALKWIQNHS